MTAVTSVMPAANSHDAPVSTSITATFDQDINPATASFDTVAVHSQRGRFAGSSGTVATTGPSVAVQPSTPFFPSELVQVTFTSGTENNSGEEATPHVWQFRTSVTRGSGILTDSGQVLAAHATFDVALGDLDNDGDLDMFESNGGQYFDQANRVWLNDGDGGFTDSGQTLGNHRSFEAGLGDLDGDGDLDAFVANSQGNANRVWLNNGGVFADSGQTLGNHNSLGISLGDVDGDGDLDAFVANLDGHANRVWNNDGNGVFTESQIIGDHNSIGVALGDFDADGDLDAFVTNGGQVSAAQGGRVYLNDSTGQFTDTGQSLADHRSGEVALGDLDGDGDLDAFVVNAFSTPNRVWLNDGAAAFTDSGQALGDHTTYGVSLGDVDGDGDLDAFTSSGFNHGVRIWTNEAGQFSDSGQVFGTGFIVPSRLGDLDGDGDLDAFVGRATQTNYVLLDPLENTASSLTISATDSTKAEGHSGATDFSFQIMRSGNLDNETMVQYSVSGSGDSAADADDSGGTLPTGTVIFAAAETEKEFVVTVTGDSAVEPDESFTVTLENPTPTDTELAVATASATIENDDFPPPEVSLQLDTPAIPEAGGNATVTAVLSAATTQPVTVDLGFSGTAVASVDYAASGTQIVIDVGETTGAVTITAVSDTDDEQDEVVVVDIVDVTNGVEDGEQQQTVTILDDDDPTGLVVTSLIPTASGFVAEFSLELEAAVLNVFDTASAVLGASDVTVIGSVTGTVAGSLVLHDDLMGVTFINSGGPLPADTYTVTLRSAIDGFRDLTGLLLDGDGDGTAGDDHVDTFTIDVPVNSVVVSLPDIVRGPGQDVHLPADSTVGIPVFVSGGTGLRTVEFQIHYDPALLSITAATAGPNMPAGTTVELDISSAGSAVLTVSSPADLPEGDQTLVDLQAAVPIADATANYGQQQVLNVEIITVTDANANPLPAVADDAFHLVSYFADVSGNGRINAGDAAGVARIAALLETGFSAMPLTDPTVVGDISGNARLNAADASLVAQFAALLEVPQIPPIPGGVVVAGLANPAAAGIEPRRNETTKSADVTSAEWDYSGSGDVIANPDDPAIPLTESVDVVVAQLVEPGFEVTDQVQSLEEAVSALLGVAQRPHAGTEFLGVRER